MKFNNISRVLSIILSVIMIFTAIPVFGVMAEETATEVPEYYFWDEVEYTFDNMGSNSLFNKGDDGSLVVTRKTLGGLTFGLKSKDGSTFTLNPNTSYRLSFKYKVTELTDAENPYIYFYPCRYAIERKGQGDYGTVVGRVSALDGAVAEGAVSAKNEAVRITSVMDDYAIYTVNFTTNSLMRTIGNDEWTYDEVLFLTYGLGSIVYDDFEIAEITQDQIAAESYVRKTNGFPTNTSTYVNSYVNPGNATSIYENGILTGTGQGGTQLKIENPNYAGMVAFYFDGENYKLDASTTYTIRFRAYAGSISPADSNTGITGGVHVFPAVGHKPDSSNKLDRGDNPTVGTGIYAANTLRTVSSYGGDTNAKNQRPFIGEAGVLKTYEYTFTTPASFNEHASLGTCNYFMIALLGKGYTLYIDRIEIAKVTGSTTYYPNLNGSQYTNNPNKLGITVNRSLVMNDAVVKPLELSGCADADMSNFKFTGWYSDRALDTTAVNDTAACYAAWDIIEDYTITRDYTTVPFEVNGTTKDVATSGINVSNDSGKVKINIENKNTPERYMIKDNNYSEIKLYPNSAYKIVIDYELAQDSNISLGMDTRFCVNFNESPTTLLSATDNPYTLDNNANLNGKLVYYFSTNDFGAFAHSRLGQYVDTLCLSIRGTGTISFSSITLTAMAGDSFPSEFTFNSEATAFIVPNNPGTVTRYALTVPTDGSSVSVFTNIHYEVDTLGLKVNDTVLFETSDEAGRVYTATLTDGDKISFEDYNKYSEDTANFGVIAAQTVDYPDSDSGIRFRIRSSNFVEEETVKTYYNGKVYTVVNYGIKVGESFVKDDIAKANALKSEGTDISFADATAYHITDTYTDYTLAVKDVDEDKYIYAVGYMLLADDDDTTADITVYTKNVLVNSYADLQNGTLGSIITIPQK